MKLDQLEQCMRPQFIWDRTGLKVLQTNEEYEGAKDIARVIFVGLGDMYGFKQQDVMDYLEMTYDSYRSKLGQFKANLQAAAQRNSTGTQQEDQLGRFWNKVGLCINAINRSQRNKYLNIADII